MPPFARTLIQAAIGLILIGVCWTIAAALADPLIFPPPASVLANALKLIASEEFRGHVGATWMTLLTGLLPAAILAILLGLAAASSPTARWTITTLVIVPAAAPLIVFAAPLVLWLGLSAGSKITLVFLVAVFAMVNQFTGAFRHTGLSPAGTPGASGAADVSPRFGLRIAVATLSSLRLGIMLGVGAAVVGEMFASTKGLGYLITTYTATFNTPGLMTTLAAVLVPTAVAGVILQAIEEQVSG